MIKEEEIIIFRKGGQDHLSWHFEKSGCFSVKSGYRLALSEKLKTSVSNSSLIQKWWSLLWSLHLPPKVRIFIWRVYLDATPSLANLWKRKVVPLPHCARCGSGMETTTHSLFWCGKTKKVWGASCFDNFFDNLSGIPTIEVFLCLFSQSSKDELALFCFISWALWENHNVLLRGDSGKNPE